MSKKTKKDAGDGAGAEKPKRVMSEEQKAKIRASMLKRQRALKKAAPLSNPVAAVGSGPVVGAVDQAVGGLVLRYGAEAISAALKRTIARLSGKGA